MKITAEGKSLLTCTHEQRKLDLRPYNGPEEGYVEDSCFQEVDIASREVLFKWCGLDALELWHTYVYLDIAENVANHTGEIFGKGDMREPWDWLHIVRCRTYRTPIPSLTDHFAELSRQTQ